MRVGLGTGSTAAFAVEHLAHKLRQGTLRDVIAVPTSVRTARHAAQLGIPLTTLDDISELDVAIDGADAVDQRTLALVKGGGGALLREKLVEVCAKVFVVIVDDAKICDGLGPSFPIPVEIVQFCHRSVMRRIEALPALRGCRASVRMGSVTSLATDGDEPAVTDNGNFIADLYMSEPIVDVAAAAHQLSTTCGVVEHGLFVGMASEILVASAGGVEVLSVNTPLPLPTLSHPRARL